MFSRERSEVRAWILRLLEVGAVALVYYAAAFLGLTLAFRNSSAAPAWPPSGIGLTAMFAMLILLTMTGAVAAALVRRHREEVVGLRKTQEDLVEYVDNMSTLSAKVATDGTLLLVNRAAQRASGIPYSELMKMRFLEAPWWGFDPVVQARVADAFARAVSGLPVAYNEQLRSAPGRILTMDFSLVPVFGSDGRVGYVLAEARDITAQKNAEERLRDSEARYRLLAEHSTDVITRNSPEGVILYASPSVKAVLGYDPGEFIGQRSPDFIHPDDLTAMQIAYARILHLREDATVTCRVRRKDGDFVWMESSARAIRDPATGAVREILNTSRDITDRRRAEEERDRSAAQLLQGQKLQAIGQLSAGIAHELNNPTGFILSNLTTLSDYFNRLSRLLKATDEAVARRDRGELVEEVRADLDRLRKELDADFIIEDFNQAVNDSIEGGKRIRDIVLSLRAFSHADEGERRLTDLNECLESTIRLCWNELKYRAAVRREQQPLPPVYAYPQRLSQLFVNLLVNAAQSIPDRGEICIATFTEDGHAVVRVSDTGAGIPRDLLPRVFEPFFTTKPVGRGTGLGLHIAHKIVEAHGGRIEIRSEEGKGTAVTVRLPLAPENERCHHDHRAPEDAAREGADAPSDHPVRR